MYNNILEVNLNKFKDNISAIKKLTSKEIMPVIKAHAYSTYLDSRLDILNMFNIIAVARTTEAINIRKIGYQKDIFILNQPSIDEIELINKYNFIIGVSSKDFLNKINKKVRIHLEIETGMNRTGINLNDLNDIISIVEKNKNIIVEGMYTHFSKADSDKEYTEYQINNFKKAYNLLKDKFNLKYIHSSASSGILFYNDKISNLIRPGLILYGYYPNEEAKNIIKLQPITKLKSKIIFIKELPPGEMISYGGTYITKNNTKVATIPIGYADGINRLLSNRGSVIIKGKKCPIIGSICMDSLMVDVTGLNVDENDTVVLFDNEIITVEEIAKLCNTINYEVLTNISDRVKRVFVE